MNNFALELLVDGKTDTELLNILVAALTENNDECLNRLIRKTDYSDDRSETVIVSGAIINQIVEGLRSRIEDTEDEDGDGD